MTYPSIDSSKRVPDYDTNVTLATAYCVVRYAIEWSNNLIPMAIIATMMVASLSPTPLIYGPPPNSPPDFELE